MLLILGVIAILVLIYLVVLVVRTGSSAERRDAEALPPPPLAPDQEAAEGDDEDAAEASAAAATYGSASGLRRSFRRARQRLRDNVAGPRPVYGLPWFLVLGAAASHRPDLWRHAGMSLPFGPPDDDALSLEGCNWWFFDGGVLIDVAGDWVLRGDGRSADDERFGELLALLQRHRPKKPIDGVVLTISSRELLDARRRGYEGLAELEQRAARIYRRIWQTQKRLSIRFPIYVAIVDGQEIPGFHAFCSELPESFGREIFGWSSPYSVDAAYQDTWVAEALDKIGTRLRQIRTQIFGARPGIDDSDGVFLFPRVLEELAEPLRIFLNQIFKQSAYHESILCRGIYFCGTDEPPGQASAEPAARRTYFVRDLLERKVFPEGGLARATATAVVARHRRVRLVQALLLLSLLVLGLGVYRTWVRRDHSSDVFHHVLRQVATDLGEMRTGERYNRTLVKTRTLELLRGMAALDIDHFRAFFLPTSWLSSFDRRLKDALAQAFKEVVFQSLELEIRSQGHRLTEIDLAGDAPPTARAAAPREPSPLGRMPEFVELEEFVEGLASYEEAIATFNRLCAFLPAESSHEQLQDLAELVRHLFATELPPQFFETSHLYEEALRRVTHPPIQTDGETWREVRERARAKVDALAARFLERLFRGNALNLALEQLTADLGALTQPEFRAAAQETRMRAALAAMGRVEDVLVHPDIAWAFRDELDLGPRYDDLIGMMRASQFLGDDVAQSVEDATAAGWLSFRRALALSASEITGPHLEVEDGEALRALAGEVKVLMAALQDFLDQSFMNAGETQGLLRVPPGHRLAWDTLLLEQAAALYEPFERFRSRGLEPFPAELRAHLERLARARLGTRMLDLVARAQGLEPVPRTITPLLVEPDLEAEVEDFAAASEYLHRILGVFEQLNLRQARQDLAGLVADQGLRLLEGVDRLLAEEKLYLPLRGGFAWWNGERPPTLRAFGVADPDELEAYLELQRARVQHLAIEYAQPLITTLGKIGVERQVVNRAIYGRWEAILQELYGFENKKPGNSVTDLEELIRSEMARVTLDDCAAARAARAPRGKPRDYFLERRSRLQEGLFERCQELAYDRAMTRYASSAAFFNQRLAGRFPFAAGVPGELDPAADPDDLRTFLRDFDAYAGYFRSVPERFDDGAIDAVRRFVEQVRPVRDFFDPFLAGAGEPAAAGDAPSARPAAAGAEAEPAAAPAPVFDVDVDFRANRDFESGGDQIIAWTLELGNDRIGHRDARRRGRWELGQPVRLVLRWAKDGRERPVLASPRHGVAVAEREVTFEQRDRWSLLSFVAAHRSSREDFRDFVDPRPHTLKFVVPTWEGNGAEAAVEGVPPPAAELSETRVFVRLTVLAPDSKKPLPVPDFPGRAPPAVRGTGDAVGLLRPASDEPRTENLR